MITINNINRFNNVIEIFGLSTDTKPIKTIEYMGVVYKIRNGSIFYEENTSTAFMYDEENHIWIEQ